MMREAICVRCEKPFQQKVRKNPSPYCGDTCRVMAYRAANKRQEHCAECGVAFETYEPKRPYCSRSCATTARQYAHFGCNSKRTHLGSAQMRLFG